MEQEKKVISKLALNSTSKYIDGELMHCIKNDDVKNFAESIVKLFAIPVVSCRTCANVQLHKQVDGYGYCDKLKKKVGGINILIYDIDKFSCSEYGS
jgi:hypothetical protein